MWFENYLFKMVEQFLIKYCIILFYLVKIFTKNISLIKYQINCLVFWMEKEYEILSLFFWFQKKILK